jgi:hypothetical protein
MKTHNWTEVDDAAALYVYRFGHNKIAHSLSALAEALGIPPGSFRMRIQNFQFIATGSGLSKYAKQSARIYDRYRAATEPKLRAEVLSGIARRRRRHNSA